MMLNSRRADVTLAIQDEGGRVDLNAAGRDLIEAALRSAGAPGSLAAAIVDWRDGDDFVTPGGAEDREYAARGYPYGARDTPFDTVDELRQVTGVTPQLFERIAPLFTVHSNRPGIDPAVAPREVLRAMPQLDERTLDALLAARADAARTGGTATATLPSTVIRGVFAESPRNAFAVTAAARSADGAAFVREAVIFLPRNARVPYLFLTWRQGRLAGPADE